MPDRKIAPPIVDAVNMDLKLKPYEHFTLDNGVPVYSINAGAQEVLLVEWVFYAGNWYEDKNMVAGTTNFLLKNGTKSKKAFAINEHFEFHGAYLNRSCYNETATISLHCLAKHLPELLPVVAEILTESIFPQEEIDTYRQNQKQRLEVNLKKCDFVANRLIDEYIYGFDHPYGRYTLKEDYDKIQREELAAYYRKFYTEGKCMVFVAGKTPADLAQQLNDNFGSLPLNTTVLPDRRFDRKPSQQKEHSIVNDKEGVQGAIRIARPFPNRQHPDFSKAQVLNNIYGGFFGSRLMSNIREEKGYTYGIHSYMQNHIHESAWLISTEAGRDVCAATIDEVYKEMKILREEPVEAEELDLVRNYMIGSLLADLDGPFQIIARWKTYILNGITDEYFYNSIRTVQTITGEEIRELAKKYLNPEEFYELLVV